MSLSKLETSVKNGRYVWYCYDLSHRRLKLVIVPTRITITFGKYHNPDYTLRELKCLWCRKSLYFDKKNSFNAGSKWTGWCGRCKLQHSFVGKPIKEEPTCDEILQVLIRPSKY